MRVLAIDDDAVAPVLFGAIARKMGVEIATAADCATALNLLKSSTFDVILMDLNLKGIDGFEVTRQVRVWQKEVGCYQPIIAVTGYKYIACAYGLQFVISVTTPHPITGTHCKDFVSSITCDDTVKTTHH